MLCTRGSLLLSYMLFLSVVVNALILPLRGMFISDSVVLPISARMSMAETEINTNMDRESIHPNDLSRYTFLPSALLSEITYCTTLSVMRTRTK